MNLKKSIWEKKNVSLSKLIELFMDAKLAHVELRVEYHVYIHIHLKQAVKNIGALKNINK